ncbi:MULTISPECIES: hypothetical protein [unclassified Beijerinckia]|uniref:hypothetical protein n=1 Tax=unclassified Beijerinckia TaxID=2638183 RepID=UPI000B88D869|nr:MULTISPECIES: hypothetical protein [unclassified Beijerinckia]MDH7797849.1 3-polyprenyl-4-hydroxybenzoate decarboxylase [Beijerinckia sp. GAS462]
MIISARTPAFYNKPQSVENIIDHRVGPIVDVFDLDVAGFPDAASNESILYASTEAAFRDH